MAGYCTDTEMAKNEMNRKMGILVKNVDGEDNEKVEDDAR